MENQQTDVREPDAQKPDTHKPDAQSPGKPKCIVVAGGTGFIGTALTRLLLGQGYAPVVLSRDPERTAQRLPHGVQVVGWDGRTARGWGELADGALAIVNLAGAGIADGRWTTARKQLILESRVNAGLAVTEAVHKAEVRPQVVVQGSAVGWYGPRGDEELDETSAPGKGFLAATAGKWEPSTAAVEKLGVRRVVVRTGMVLGPRGGALEQFIRPFALFAGGVLGSGRQWVSWIHLHDQVRAMVHLIRSETCAGVYNLTAPAPVTMSEFCRELGRAMNRPSFLPAPSFALKLLLGDMAEELILKGQRVAPRRLAASGFRFDFPGLGPALGDCIAGRRQAR